MATVSMIEAARRVGRSKGTLSKAIKSGRLAYVERTAGGGYLIDLDVLHAVFASDRDGGSRATRSSSPDSVARDGEVVSLRAQIDNLHRQLVDLRSDRDAWREQACRLAAALPPRSA